jgi:hypothetical protein
MEDGNENTIADHLRDDHRKGTRGMNDEYLSDVHSTLHQRKHEPAPEHGHPGQDRDKDAGEDRGPERPDKRGGKKDNKRK